RQTRACLLSVGFRRLPAASQSAHPTVALPVLAVARDPCAFRAARRVVLGGLFALALVGCARHRPVPPEPPRAPSLGAAAAAKAPAVTEASGSTQHAAVAPARAKATMAVIEAPPPPKPRHPFHSELTGGRLPKTAAAMRFANLSPGQCRRELKARDLPFKRSGGPAKGIATPLRFADTIGSVRFKAPGGKSVFGMLDCRLALVLAELAPLLERHDVTVVRVDNMYRPRARLPGSRKRSQHSYGLAIDILGFELGDGRSLSVERDWNGRRGEPVCGPEADPITPSEAAVALRNIVCDIARSGLFHHLLTPNYDAAHGNHFHFDIKRDASTLLIR